MKRHRSVLSRLERVKILEDKGLLDPEKISCFGLPKVKHLKIRIKKEKAAAAAPGTTAAQAAPAAGAPVPAAAAKAPAKGAAGSPAQKAGGSGAKVESAPSPKKKE